MNKLLHAGFARLWKDTFFRIALIFMLVLGLLSPVFIYLDMTQYGIYIPLDSGFFTYMLPASILVPVFVSLFIGTEYRDGTMRNKLMIGHARTAVYLSNLIVSTAAGFILCIAYLIAELLTGIPLLGFFTVDTWIILKFAGCAFLLSAAFTALCALVSMLQQSRSASAVICILGSFFLLIIGMYFETTLSLPEYYADYGFYYLDPDAAEDDEETELVPNPHYIGGKKREIYQFLLDFIPGGQVITLTEFNPAANLQEMSLYSVIISVTSTGLGIYFFRKKDIK